MKSWIDGKKSKKKQDNNVKVAVNTTAISILSCMAVFRTGWGEMKNDVEFIRQHTKEVLFDQLQGLIFIACRFPQTNRTVKVYLTFPKAFESLQKIGFLSCHRK